MFKRFILFIFVVCIGTPIYVSPNETLNLARDKLKGADTYKTKEILLLFKSCYETIYFLGNTKYKGTRKPLLEEKVSEQCFCICDKIRKKHPPETFLNRRSSELQKIIAPLSNECIQDLGPFWESVENE